MQKQDPASHRITLTPLDARSSGALAYALSRDGEPLGLVMKYVMEGPGSWHGFVRPSAQDRLAQLAGSPFQDLEAVVRAVRDALADDRDIVRAGTSISA